MIEAGPVCLQETLLRSPCIAGTESDALPMETGVVDAGFHRWIPKPVWPVRLHPEGKNGNVNK